MEQTITPSKTVSESLTESWNAVNGNIWLFIGFTVLYYITIAIVGAVPVIGSIITNAFSFVFAVSMFSAFYQIDRHRHLSFQDFFNWTPRFGRLLTAHLCMIALALAVIVPVILLANVIFEVNLFTLYYDLLSNPFRFRLPRIPAGMVLYLVVASLAGFFVLYLLSFSLQFIVLFRELTIMESLKLSWKVGRSNIGHLLLFILLAIGISILGMLVLCVGLLVAIPVIMGMQYYFLRGIFPMEDVRHWDFMGGEEKIL